MQRWWIAVAAFVAMAAMAGSAAASSYCEVFTKDRKYYYSPIYEQEFRSLSYAASHAASPLDPDSHHCWHAADRAASQTDLQDRIARARARGFTPVAWDIRERLQDLKSYYFCQTQGSTQLIISDLILNPGWVEPSVDSNPFATRVRAIGQNHNVACRRTTPLAYIALLNENQRPLLRLPYNSEGRAFGANLIDNLAEREKYAKLWADPKNHPWEASASSFAACLNSHDTGVYATAAFPADRIGYEAALSADAERRWGSSRFVSCKTGKTAQEVEQAVRRAHNVTVKPWSLPWEPGAKPAAPAPPKPQPAQPGYLTIKTDTSIADTARAWDAQVAKTLAQEAQKKAELAVKQAQADAKTQALIEKARQERRRRGAAQ